MNYICSGFSSPEQMRRAIDSSPAKIQTARPEDALKYFFDFLPFDQEKIVEDRGKPFKDLHMQIFQKS